MGKKEETARTESTQEVFFFVEQTGSKPAKAFLGERGNREAKRRENRIHFPLFPTQASSK